MSYVFLYFARGEKGKACFMWAEGTAEQSGTISLKQLCKEIPQKFAQIALPSCSKMYSVYEDVLGLSSFLYA